MYHSHQGCRFKPLRSKLSTALKDIVSFKARGHRGLWDQSTLFLWKLSLSSWRHLWCGQRRERRLFVLLCTLSNLTQKQDQGVLQTRSSLPGNSINPTAPPPFSSAVWLQQERGAGRYGFLVVLNRACSRFKGEEPAGAIRHRKVGAKYLQSHSAAVAHLSFACPHSSLPSAAPALGNTPKVLVSQTVSRSFANTAPEGVICAHPLKQISYLRIPSLWQRNRLGCTVVPWYALYQVTWYNYSNINNK